MYILVHICSFYNITKQFLQKNRFITFPAIMDISKTCLLYTSSITISKNDFKDGKCIKQLYTPKVLGMLDESLPTLKCKFRLSKENSKTISIDPATGIIARDVYKRQSVY